MAELSQRTNGLELTSEAAAPGRPHLHVGLAREGPGSWTGTLEISGEGRVLRRVRGQDCNEVLLAVAAIAAVRMPLESSPSAPEPMSRPVAEAAPERSPAPVPDTSASDAVPVTLTILTHAGYSAWLEGSFRAALRAELGWDRSVSSWVLAATAAYHRGSTEGSFAGTGLQALTGQVDLCPPGLDGKWVWLRGCAFARSGAVMMAEPSAGLVETTSTTLPSLAVGAGLHVGWPLFRSFTLVATGDAGVRVLREEFVVRRVSTTGESLTPGLVYRGDRVTFELSAGIGYAF